MPLGFVALAILNQAPWGKPVKDHWPHAYDLLDVKWHVKLLPSQYAIQGEVTNTVKALSDGATLLFDSVGLKILSATVDGKWFNASDAKDYGFVDHVVTSLGQITGGKA